MDFALDEDQVTLQEVLRTFFEAQVPDTAVRAQFDDPLGYDTRLWKRMADELGLQGLAIPEEYGGGGFGFFELGLVLEEMGRSLLPSPFLGSCVMAAQLLLALDDEEARERLLPDIDDGRHVRPSTTPCGRRRRARRIGRQSPRWSRPTASTYILLPGARTSRSTAASGSPGSTRHTYIKRAKSSQVLLGDSDLHRLLLADRIGV